MDKKKVNYNLEDLQCIVGIICDMLDNNKDNVDSIGESFDCWCENGDVFYEDDDIERAEIREDLMNRVAPYVDNLTDFLLGLYNDLEDNDELENVNVEDFNKDNKKESFYDLCKKSKLPYFWELITNRNVEDKELKLIADNIRSGYNCYMKPNINLRWELIVFDTKTLKNRNTEFYIEGSKLENIADLVLQGIKRDFLNSDEVISVDE